MAVSTACVTCLSWGMRVVQVPEAASTHAVQQQIGGDTARCRGFRGFISRPDLSHAHRQQDNRCAFKLPFTVCLCDYHVLWNRFTEATTDMQAWQVGCVISVDMPADLGICFWRGERFAVACGACTDMGCLVCYAVCVHAHVHLHIHVLLVGPCCG